VREIGKYESTNSNKQTNKTKTKKTKHQHQKNMQTQAHTHTQSIDIQQQQLDIRANYLQKGYLRKRTDVMEDGQTVNSSKTLN